MIIRAIRNLLSLLPQIVQPAAEAWEKKRFKPRLLDVLEARFLSEEARKRNVGLAALLKQRRSDLERTVQKRAVRKKVDALIAPYYRHPDIMEEVTEKLFDVASHDPFYKRWFTS